MITFEAISFGFPSPYGEEVLESLLFDFDGTIAETEVVSIPLRGRGFGKATLALALNLSGTSFHPLTGKRVCKEKLLLGFS